jgi:protein phosphatase
MACTIATVVIQNQQAYIANVGDSRIYLIRNNQVILLSQDHTFVADQVRAGKMTEEEAERSDRKHVITRSLGIQPTVEVYHSTIELREDDWLLLCSDGLYGVLDEVDFVEAINTFEAPQKTAKALVNEALVLLPKSF